MALSHTQKELAKDIAVIVLLQGANDDGESIYFYLGIRGDKYEEFIQIQQTKESFNPEDFGTVILSGVGTPDDEVKEYMTKEFGFNHESQVVSTPKEDK